MKADSCTRQADRHDRQNDTKINREGMRHRVKEGVGVKTEDQYRGRYGGSRLGTRGANKTYKTQ